MAWFCGAIPTNSADSADGGNHLIAGSRFMARPLVTPAVIIAAETTAISADGCKSASVAFASMKSSPPKSSRPSQRAWRISASTRAD